MSIETYMRNMERKLMCTPNGTERDKLLQKHNRNMNIMVISYSIIGFVFIISVIILGIIILVTN